MPGKLFADFAVERQALYRQEVLLAGMPGLVRIKQTDIALRKSRIYSVPGRVADTVGKKKYSYRFCKTLFIHSLSKINYSLSMRCRMNSWYE